MARIFPVVLALFWAALCHAEGEAGVARALDAPPGKAAKPVFRESRQHASWRVLESEDCHFHVSYRDRKDKLARHFVVDDCSPIVSTGYELLGHDVLIANRASERGGHVIIFHASRNGMQWAEARYESSDESGFAVSRSGENISIETDRSRLMARILARKIDIRTSRKPLPAH